MFEQQQKYPSNRNRLVAVELQHKDTVYVFAQTNLFINGEGPLVSEETVVLRRWGVEANGWFYQLFLDLFSCPISRASGFKKYFTV